MRSAAAALAILLGFAAAALAGAELPDPTRPALAVPAAGSVEAPAGSYALSAVWIGAQRRVALINGRPVAVGDSVDGARVLAIDASGVRIRAADGERVLSLASGVRKAPAEEWSR